MNHVFHIGFAFFFTVLGMLFTPSINANAQTSDIALPKQTDTNDHSSPAKGSLFVQEADEQVTSPYQNSQIIWDFVQIAFSNALWLETIEDQSFLVRSRLTDRNLVQVPEAQKWMRKYLENPSMPARVGVINKWAMPEVTVGVGWPSPTEGFFKHSPPEQPSHDFIKIVQAVTENIAKISGLKIKFIPPDSPKEKTDGFARIRVVPISATRLHNKYKSYIVDASYFRHPRNHALQELLRNAVEFTPYSRSQVDGFFIPDSENQIEFAACRIANRLSHDMQVALITECLLRSLGMPETVKLFRGVGHKEEHRQRFQMSRKNFFLGLWNQAEDRSSKTIFHDGESALDITSHEELTVFDEETKTMRSVYQPVKPLHWGEEAIPNALKTTVDRYSITDYDAKMLSLLYCTSVKPGMDKEQVIRVLASDGSCGARIHEMAN